MQCLWGTKNHQECPFCYKSSNPISKKKIDTLGKILFTCLSRNTVSRKDETAINPDKTLSLKNDKERCVIEYKRNSIIVHLGNHRAGHYVCFTLGNHSVLKIDDERIKMVEYNSVLQIIRTCGYIIINRKISDRFLNDNESNETDTETSDENNNLSHGKFMKKRKLPSFSNAKIKVDERSRYVHVEFKLCVAYIAESNFGSQWVNKNQSKLDFVTANFTKLVNVTLSKGSRNNVSYRHCLFLDSKLGILNKLCDTSQVKFILPTCKTKVGTGGKRRKTLRSPKSAAPSV